MSGLVGAFWNARDEPPSGRRWWRRPRRIQERDERDSGRAVAPLRKAEGAMEVDTTYLSFEAQVEVIINHVKVLTDG